MLIINYELLSSVYWPTIESPSGDPGCTRSFDPKDGRAAKWRVNKLFPVRVTRI